MGGLEEPIGKVGEVKGGSSQGAGVGMAGKGLRGGLVAPSEGKLRCQSTDIKKNI